MSNKKKNKTVVITGANSGLGLRLAIFLVKKNYEVVLCSRKLSNLNKVLKDTTGINHNLIHTIKADVSNKKDVNKIKKYLHTKLDNNVDVLVNNASVIGPIGEFSDNNIDEWINTININLIGSVIMTNLVIPIFKKKRKGKIIQLSGGGASGPFPNFSSYATSKIGIVRFIETISGELKKYNIDANCIAPGFMNTNMQKNVVMAGEKKVGKQYYEKVSKVLELDNDNFNKPINLIEFLISNKSDGITGKFISAVWDNWKIFSQNKKKLSNTDVFTLRRIVGKDRKFKKGDL